MKSYVTAYSVANTVRMLRTQWKGAIAICEGSTDARVFSRFIDPTACRIEVAHGKDNALGALDILVKDGINGVLAILDRDAILLLPALLDNPDIMVTDNHDLESMMIQSPALDKLVAEFGSAAKIDVAIRSGRSIRDLLSNAAFSIGLLRLASVRHGLNLKFEGCDFGAFVDKETLNVHQEKLIAEVLNKTRSHALKQPAILDLMNQEREFSMNTWDVCCGHDLTEIFSIGLRKLLGSCNAAEANSTSIERSLRLAYEASYFRQTSLYSSIKLWEKSNAPFLVLS